MKKHIAKLEGLWFGRSKKATELSPESADILKNLLATLRAMAWSYQTSHWTANGESYYGDHLMFQRFYEALPAEIDGLGEKIVAYLGETAVDQMDQCTRAGQFLSSWAQIPCLFHRGLVSERQLQDLLMNTLDMMEEMGELSMGLDDFLPALANAHETNIYLLQQRIKGKKKF